MSSPLTVAEGVMEEMVVKEDMAVMAVVVAMVVVAVTAATAAMAVTAVKETVPTGSLRDGLGRVETVPEVETVAMVATAEMAPQVAVAEMLVMVLEAETVEIYTYKSMATQLSDNVHCKYFNSDPLVDKVAMVDLLGPVDIPVLEDVQAMLALQVLAVREVLAINMARVVHRVPQESLVARVGKWDYDTAMPVMDTMDRLDILAI